MIKKVRTVREELNGLPAGVKLEVGTVLEIADDSRAPVLVVKLPDGRHGYLSKHDYEVVEES